MIDFTDENMEEMLRNIKKPRSRTGNDKIFDNNFNTGQIDYEIYKNAVVDNRWYDSSSQQQTNSFDYYRKQELDALLEKLYTDTEYQKKYSKIKKIPKNELAEIFSFLKELIQDDSYSNVELFIGIADFLDVNYKILYTMISTNYKIQLLQELNKDYKKINTDNVVKLF